MVTRRQAACWILTAAIAAVTVIAALRRPVPQRLADLSVYLGAARGPETGVSLYDFVHGTAPFTYPPFAGLMFRPLTWLPTPAVQVLWSMATVAAVLGVAALLHRAQAGALALVLMLSAPVASNLRFGQVSLFLAGLVLVDVLALRRTPWFGALIGLAAAIKLTPLILVPLLWCAGRRAAAATAAGTFAGCAAIGAAALPGDSWRYWTTEVFAVHRLGAITNVGNQSLNGALMRLDAGPGLRSLLVPVIGGAIAALALWRGARLARAGDWLSATVVAGAASVVLSPVSWTHHQVWLVLAVLLPVRGPAGARTAWGTTVLAVMLLPLPALGPPIWSNSRLALAVVIAAALPIRTPTRSAAAPARAPARAAGRPPEPAADRPTAPAARRPPAAAADRPPGPAAGLPPAPASGSPPAAGLPPASASPG
jgi:alpha-1,2-mannosyltransferase